MFMITLSISAGKPCPQRPPPPPPHPSRHLHIQPSDILRRYVVLKNGSLGCNTLFLWKDQLLVFLVLFRAIWSLEEFNQSDRVSDKQEVLIKSFLNATASALQE